MMVWGFVNVHAWACLVLKGTPALGKSRYLFFVGESAPTFGKSKWGRPGAPRVFWFSTRFSDGVKYDPNSPYESPSDQRLEPVNQTEIKEAEQEVASDEGLTDLFPDGLA